MVRVLGIDPGSRLAGYACVEVERLPVLQMKQCRVIDAGVLKVDSKVPFGERIGHLHDALHVLTCDLQPDVGVFEDAFCHKNFRSALKLAQARGALLTAVTREGKAVAELSPTAVKKSIVGSGHATKEQVALTLEACLGFRRGVRPFDVTDALAIAVTYAMTIRPLGDTHGFHFQGSTTQRSHLRV
ncbi:MAG: crossover junction endodeoxyribonuclease RuvC [Oligoflexales bacterium]